MRAGAGAPEALSPAGGGGKHLSQLLTTIIRHQLSPSGLLAASSGQSSWTHLAALASPQADYSTTRNSNHFHQQHHHHAPPTTTTTYNSPQLHNQQQAQQAAAATQLVAALDHHTSQLQLSQQTIHGTQAAASALTGQTTPAPDAADWWRDYWSRQPFPSGYTQSSITLLACLIATIIFLIVVGNLLVCIAIFTEKSLKPTQNWFIASLAVSDMLLGLVVMPFSLARELMGFWIFGTLWCDIHEAIDVLLTTASINTLCLISLDRYWSITQAVSYLKKRTPRRGAFMIAFVWIFSAAVSLPPLFGWKKPTPSIVASPPEVAGSNSSAAASTLISAGGQVSSMDMEDVGAAATATAMLDLELLSTTALPVPTAPPPPEPSLVGAPAEYPMCQLSDDVGYVLYSALGSFFLPCAVMVFTYIKIFLAARSRARRAINKQSRSGAGTNKRTTATRRSQATIQGTTNDSGKPTQQSGLTSDTAPRKSSAGGPSQQRQSPKKGLAGAAGTEKRVRSPEPPIKGKIVVVERRKSMAVVQGGLSGGVCVADAERQAAAMKAVCSTFSLAAAVRENRINRATYTCSELVAEQAGAGSSIHCGSMAAVTGSESIGLAAGQSSATLSTSDAKIASRSVLNSSISNDSSMITVMNASMIEMPVTHFNFNSSSSSQDQQVASKTTSDHPTISPAVPLDEPSSSLLNEIAAKVSADSPEIQHQPNPASNPESIPSPVPHIVVDEKRSFDHGDKQVLETRPETVHSLQHATNETCFMTMEEDSDIFDAQAGRTVVMLGLNRNPNPNSNDVMCNSLGCRPPRQHTHSASSYCGSSLTINEDEDLDDCVDDELMTDDCNGLSMSCGLDQYSSCIHCQECEKERASSTGASGGNQSSPHSRVGQLNPLSPSRLAADLPSTTKNHQEASASLRAHRQHECYHHHSGYDDNLSMTEYRSNDDSSSFVGHDVLDATEKSTSPSKKKPFMVVSGTEKNGTGGGGGGGVASGLAGYLAERKRSTIGSRLSRLGSSNAPLSNEAGGLLDLASRGQPGGGGARNLKALRQNFFMKLNQLTAKSATKSSKTKPKNTEFSVSGIHSSESCEASVDCATTSNVHSAEYQQETTTNDEIQSGVKESSSRGGQEFDELAGRLDKQFLEAERYPTLSVRTGDEDGPLTTIHSNQNPQRLIHQLDSGNTSKNNNISNNNHDDDDDDDDEKTIDKSVDRSAMLRDTRRDNNAKLRSNLVDLNDSKLPVATTTRPASRSSGTPGPAGAEKKVSLRQNGLKKGSAAYQMNHTSGSGSHALPSPGGPPREGGGGSQTSRAYLASDNERHKRKLAKARERRATLILGLIMAAFICSWMPFFTFYVIRAVCVSCREYMNPRFEAFIFWMGYCNSAINPIIYTIFNRDFRKAFRKILFKCL